jgi:hypothetical protein
MHLLFGLALRKTMGETKGRTLPPMVWLRAYSEKVADFFDKNMRQNKDIESISDSI